MKREKCGNIEFLGNGVTFYSVEDACHGMSR
jgi:hypothetical protein